MFNATFNNISVICGGQFYWWRKLEYPEKPAASHWQTLSHNIVLNTSCHERDSSWQLEWQSALMAYDQDHTMKAPIDKIQMKHKMKNNKNNWTQWQNYRINDEFKLKKRKERMKIIVNDIQGFLWCFLPSVCHRQNLDILKMTSFFLSQDKTYK